MNQKAMRQIYLFLAVLGLVALLPAMYTMGLHAFLRMSGEPLQVVMTRSWLKTQTSSNFNFHRNGRAHQEANQHYQAEFAVLDSTVQITPKAPSRIASNSAERVQQAVDAVMAKINPPPIVIPESAPRFIRDNLPAAVADTLYPGKILQAKYSGKTLILADEYALILPEEKQVILGIGLILLALSGAVYAMSRMKHPSPSAVASADEPNSSLVPAAMPNYSNALQICSVEHWDTNEYEGQIVASWIDGRSDCFFVRLIGDDEWEQVQAGKTWVAQIEFDCFEGVEYSADGAGFTPQLSQLVGTNYRICGQILHLNEDSAMLDLPWPVLIDDLSYARKQQLPLQKGGWLRATGILQAKMPDDESDRTECQTNTLPNTREMALAAYAYDIGVPLRDFLPRLHLCQASEADGLIHSGQFKLDGVVLTDPAIIIKTPMLHPQSVAQFGQQQVVMSFWRDAE